ncbi:MAG: hypothetical protein Kow009_05840 [Spirochaetales bacterium]
MGPKVIEKVREPIVEGLLYPEDPTVLKDLIAQYEATIPDPAGSSIGILTPHAAYDRCGALIARAFHTAGNRPVERVILIGSVHRDEEEAIFLPESNRFRTPLGTLSVDEEAVEALFTSGTRFAKNDIPHLEEHCLEIQLPFLSYHFPGVKILPILIGKSTRSNIQLLSHALKGLFSHQWEKTLFVVTSNASHITLPHKAEKEADRFLELAQRHDWKSLILERSSNLIGACGAGGVATLIHLFGSSLQFTPLGRVVSTDDQKENGMVYLSARIDLKKT